MKMSYFLFAFAFMAFNTNADISTVEAAVGGAIGGAVGAAVGNEVGGRNGAIIGGAIGGGAGAAVATDGHNGHDSHQYSNDNYRRHCPPGHAKKGQC